MLNLLLEKGADIKHRNNLNLTALDYGILHGNYEIAYTLRQKDSSVEIKPLEDYIHHNLTMNIPSFKIPIFYQSLKDNVEPGKTPPMHLTNDEKKKLEGKVPDPNESWTSFFKRIVNFEVHRPPLVDIKSLSAEQSKSVYMFMQNKYFKSQNDIKTPLTGNTDVRDIELQSNENLKSETNINSKSGMTVELDK